jgi:glycerol dehydrogenase
MTTAVEYTPHQPLALPPGAALPAPPRVFGTASRYIQGHGVLEHAGHYLSRLGFHRCAVLASERSQQAEGGRLIRSLEAAGVEVVVASFHGECSRREIQRHVDALLPLDPPVNGVLAIGGGKAVDAGRAIAHRLDLPVAVVPTLASNDAPCAAVSVIYTPEGVTEDAEVYDRSPALVLVDSAIIAGADARYLAAGMGDAMATWYEARACARASHGMTVYGGRPTLAATALAELCARTLYEDGERALQAVRDGVVNEALERVIEANTLLSGVGYECGGLAVAHGIAQGYTVIEHVHERFLHGEMVAMGTLAQLLLEASQDPAAQEEAERAARFFVQVGLPVQLQQLALSPQDEPALRQVVEAAMLFPFIGNMPFAVTADALFDAVLAADRLGRRVSDHGKG